MPGGALQATVAEDRQGGKRLLALGCAECQSQPRRGRLAGMRREFSAGGVVARAHEGAWELAAIRPGGKTRVWALPKGNIGPGEPTEEAAAREVTEETGLVGALVAKLGRRALHLHVGGRADLQDRQLLPLPSRVGRARLDRPRARARGRRDALAAASVHAPSQLTYSGEREMVAQGSRLAWPGSPPTMMRQPRAAHAPTSSCTPSTSTPRSSPTS